MISIAITYNYAKYEYCPIYYLLEYLYLNADV